MKIKIILVSHTLPVKCVFRKSEISNPPHTSPPTQIMLLCIGVLQGCAATELWKLQQWSSETHLHSWPLGGVNAIWHSWFPTQQENTQRYNWWRLPFIRILFLSNKSSDIKLFLCFFLAMGLATLEVMQAMQRTWSNSKVRVNGKTRQMQWRDMFGIAVKWRRWELLILLA